MKDDSAFVLQIPPWTQGTSYLYQNHHRMVGGGYQQQFLIYIKTITEWWVACLLVCVSLWCRFEGGGGGVSQVYHAKIILNVLRSVSLTIAY